MGKRRNRETAEEKQERQAKPFGISSDNTISNITLSKKQKQLIELIDKNDVIVVTGPAGTSKTFIDCYYAVKSLRDGQFEKSNFH